jgi:hypothetical protein
MYNTNHDGVGPRPWERADHCPNTHPAVTQEKRMAKTILMLALALLTGSVALHRASIGIWIHALAAALVSALCFAAALLVSHKGDKP